MESDIKERINDAITNVEEVHKRTLIKKYFSQTNFWLILGIIFIGLPVAFKTMGNFAMIPIVLIVGFLYYRRKRNKVTGEMIDNWLKEDLKIIAERAIQKSGISKDKIVSKPLFILGLPKIGHINAAKGFKQKKDEKDAIRFSPICVICFYLTDNQIIEYSCGLDMFTGNPLNENTNEFFLKDIVSVATETRSETFQLSNTEKVQANTAEVFELTSSGGNKISAIVNSPEIIEKFGGKYFALSRAEESIQAIRECLRNRKSAA